MSANAERLVVIARSAPAGSAHRFIHLVEVIKTSPVVIGCRTVQQHVDQVRHVADIDRAIGVHIGTGGGIGRAAQQHVYHVCHVADVD